MSAHLNFPLINLPAETLRIMFFGVRQRKSRKRLDKKFALKKKARAMDDK
jgi:hypothetical protein